MIKGTFQFGGDISEVIVRGNELLFSDVSSGVMTTIDGLKLNKPGVEKEFPDLKDNPEWKKKAIERLKEHIKNIHGENKKLEYVKQELIKYGYSPLIKQRAGFRPNKF